MITTTIEAVLFAAAKPIKISHLQKNLDVSEEVIGEALADIKTRFNTPDSGIHVLQNKGTVQFVSNPATGEELAGFLKKEASGPLTRPSLETLTIIAYRGPLTKPEIEIIRGVNCSLILRNLLIRGYIDETPDAQRLQPTYTLSNEFLQKVGVAGVQTLPDYDVFARNEKINELLAQPQDDSQL